MLRCSPRPSASSADKKGLRCSPRPSASSADKKGVKVFSAPLRVLRGQKGFKVFSAPLRVLRGKQVLRCFPCPSAALRGSKVFFPAHQKLPHLDNHPTSWHNLHRIYRPGYGFYHGTVPGRLVSSSAAQDHIHHDPIVLIPTCSTTACVPTFAVIHRQLFAPPGENPLALHQIELFLPFCRPMASDILRVDRISCTRTDRGRLSSHCIFREKIHNELFIFFGAPVPLRRAALIGNPVDHRLGGLRLGPTNAALRARRPA